MKRLQDFPNGQRSMIQQHLPKLRAFDRVLIDVDGRLTPDIFLYWDITDEGRFCSAVAQCTRHTSNFIIPYSEKAEGEGIISLHTESKGEKKKDNSRRIPIRAEQGVNYFFIGSDLKPWVKPDNRDETDEENFINHNYFFSKEDCENMIVRYRALLDA